MKGNKQENSKTFLVLYLGVLSAFAPFVMDTYLASMPELAQFFSVTAAEVQLSLASCVAGLAVGQLCLGAISDSFGRKSPIIVSLALYVIATVGCIFSPSMSWFVALRFAQGLSAAGGVVLTRSIVADCYEGCELTRMYGIVGTINGVATVIAPVMGGAIAAMWGWKGVFWTLLGIGASMLSVTVYFKETLRAEMRMAFSSANFYSSILELARNAKFAIPCAGFSMFMALIIVNLSSVTFILNGMGMDEGQMSIVLGINSILLGAASLLSSRLRNQKFVMRQSSIVIMAGSAIISAALLNGESFWLYESGLMIAYIGLGALNTSSVSLAMEAGREHAGVASAILGAFGYLIGGISATLEGLAEPSASTPVMLLALSFLTIAITFLKLRPLPILGRP